ncbi:hypothetical protein BFW38_15325 [Terasakiispira papahanaumokuakeensis]|uniref:Copper chaperone PCu(A)C n=1 Tax=Terasakiispira papahanaumokuakeensis TaxID=197479 RepID=A0A1E2VCK8_9GAMM|nr:copper chaperone PCu(A)C [Terasakiispira papahanaumokuakeensis]ODC04694.1 hypothetical protein BFW38_15325 [Terasakiispira papahanaumokuakeensis]
MRDARLTHSFPGQLALSIIGLLLSAALYSSGLWAAPSIEVQHPTVRAVPPGSETTAAFMTLYNPTQEDRVLVGADSDLSEVTELHHHIMSEGVMRMRRLTRIELPAGQTVKLEPGGLHLMLIGLKQIPAEGDTVQLNLQLDNGEVIEVLTPVKKVSTEMMSAHEHHAH